MHTTSVITLAFAAAAQAGSIARRQTSSGSSFGYGDINPNDPEVYANKVCFANDNSLPCSAVAIIGAECETGRAANSSISDVESAQPPRDQQLCYCSSQFFDMLNGCAACISKHGLASVVPEGSLPSASAVSSFSSSYCQVTNTPTAGLADLFSKAIPTSKFTAYNPLATTSAPLPTFSDPIGNKTEVSYYYTPSVSKEAITAVPTSGAPTTTTKTNSAGQIVATASAKGAAAPAGVVDKLAVAGVVGIGALAAVL